MAPKRKRAFLSSSSEEENKKEGKEETSSLIEQESKALVQCEVIDLITDSSEVLKDSSEEKTSTTEVSIQGKRSRISYHQQMNSRLSASSVLESFESEENATASTLSNVINSSIDYNNSDNLRDSSEEKASISDLNIQQRRRRLSYFQESASSASACSVLETSGSEERTISSTYPDTSNSSTAIVNSEESERSILVSFCSRFMMALVTSGATEETIRSSIYAISRVSYLTLSDFNFVIRNVRGNLSADILNYINELYTED